MPSPKTLRAFPRGTVTLPSSKSLSHRALICAGLAAMAGGGQSTLHRVAQNADTAATIACMGRLGAACTTSGSATTVAPAPKPAAPLLLDCGESGSTLRLLLPLASLAGVPVTFAGQGRLMERPMDAYAAIFREQGLPYALRGGQLHLQGPLHSGTFRLPGDVSSQFISGLLLALPLLEGDSSIELTTPLESESYVHLTLDVMRQFGVSATRPAPCRYHIPGGQRYRPACYTVEGDYSQAAFFLAAGALGRPVRCAGLPPASRQGDSAIVALLGQMGAAVQREGDTLWATPTALRAIDADVRDIPDLVPPLAALCCFAQGTSHITGAARLRLKESDRLSALTQELRKLGANIHENPDSLTITGTQQLRGGTVDAHGDHRIAMALAVAAIRCASPVTLAGWQHVSKSYPCFWQDFEQEAANV